MAIKDWPAGVVRKTPVTPAGNITNSAASGIWSMKDVAYWVKQNNWPNPANLPSDQYFEQVSLLLTGNGTNGAQNNTFLDSSTNNFTITRNGNATQGTLSPYGNLWSNYFEGGDDFLTTTTTSASAFGTGDFSIEAWVCATAAGAERTIVSNLTSSGSGDNQYYFYASNTAIVFSGWYTVFLTASYTLPIGKWTHLAVVRTGTVLSIYADGTRIGTTSNSQNFSASLSFKVGSYASGAGTWTGFLSNARVIKGSGVYNANDATITVPTTPLTAVTNTQLLTCQSNKIIDNSSNAFALTLGGTPTVNRFSPFNPTASYSAATVGGSAYLDGTGDYLNTPATGQFAPAGDFTIGYWFYLNAIPTYTALVGNYTSNVSTDWTAEVQANGALYIYLNGATVRISGGAGTIKIGQWYYLCIARVSGTITAYLNGASLGTYAQSGTFGSASKAIYIGSEAGLWPLNGYISDVKLLDGSAVTTIPTAPQTATSGTSLLLSFTNAGIPDAAMLNDLETVGNAQVSTSVVKYGTGSLAFDGTGDYLKTPIDTKQNWNFGTGDFTVEAWVYPTAAGQYDVIMGTNSGASTGGWQIIYDFPTSGAWNFNFQVSGGPYGFSFGSLSLNTWTHIAATRSGTTVRTFVNGTQVTSSTTGGSSNIAESTGTLYIGQSYENVSGRDFNGYIDDLRITKGYARYTSSFTPPNAAFPTF